MSKLFSSLATFWVLSFIFPSSALATTYYVSATGSSSGSCESQGAPCTFSRAQTVAVSGDILQIIGTIPSITVSKGGLTLDGGKIDGIANKTANSATVFITASNVTVRNLDIVGGWSYGLRTQGGKGDGLVVDNVTFYDNVLENAVGTKPGTGCTGSVTWGSPFRAYNTSNIAVRNSKFYHNCGESFSVLASHDVTGTNLQIYDNFSANVYIDQSQRVRVTDSSITCSASLYDRSPGSRPMSLGAETYSDLGLTTNTTNDVTFERNKISNCRGASAYSETPGQFQNISIINNEFYNPLGVTIDPTVKGLNVITSPNTVYTGSISPSPTPKPGDTDGDAKVDGLDYVVWLNHYNQNLTGPTNGDFNNSGKVDGLDYVVWINNYGK